jgi:hypothetical protein
LDVKNRNGGIIMMPPFFVEDCDPHLYAIGNARHWRKVLPFRRQ